MLKALRVASLKEPIMKFASRIVLPLLIISSAPTFAADEPRPPCTSNATACLEKIGRLYIDALLSHDGSKIPLAANVRRTENALNNARGPHEVRESFVRTDMVKQARDIRFWANEKTGDVVFFFRLDIDLTKDQIGDGTTRAGNTDYKVSVSVPAGTYTIHEAERFRIDRGLITEIEIISHVETGRGGGSGWPVERDAAIKKP
jgi:hypothetical protein